MPPRKRAESKPAEPVEPQLGEDPAAPEAAAAEEPPPASPDSDKPKKSDLQAAEQPCPICIPNGWVEGAFSMGCEHGTWVRDNA